MYVFDILGRTDREFLASQDRESPLGGSLQYMRLDMTDVQRIGETMSHIADKHGRLDGLIAAAGIQRIGQAIGKSQEAVEQVMKTNFFGGL